MAASGERLPHFDRFMFILLGAILVGLLIAVAGVFGQEMPKLPDMKGVEAKTCINQERASVGTMPYISVHMVFDYKDGERKTIDLGMVYLDIRSTDQTFRERELKKQTAFKKARKLCDDYALEVAGELDRLEAERKLQAKREAK